MIRVVRISAGPTLHGRHVTLRPMHEGDAGDLRKLLAAPAVAECRDAILMELVRL